MSETPSPARKVSYFLIAAISTMLVLSIVMLYQVFDTYRKGGFLDLLSMTISISAIALSSYMFIQMTRKPLKLGFEIPKVSTTIQCTNCDYNNIRDFQTGDYVLKEAGPCPKCNNKAIISSILREVTEKEK